ncbi:hypothetical protein Tco_1249469 [Tanacetum coccineum]
MCTYLKNMKGKKLKDLKNKSSDSIQKMFDKAFKRVNTFVEFKTDLVKGSSKRAGEELEQKSTKKQKVDKDKDTVELQSLMEVIPDEEEVAIDDVSLATKPPTILVKDKYGSTRLVEGMDLLLWGDLKTMFEPHVEDEIWKLQQRYKVLSWKLFDSCGVHCLSLQSGMIYMLGRIVGIKSLLNAASITAAHIRVNAAQFYMDQDSIHMVAASKVPMLKPGKFELWRMRIEKYIQMIDYALWEVIENGITLPKTAVVEGVKKVMLITSTKDKAQRRLERNKAELEIISMDDLYNNFKVYEIEVKGMSSSSSSTQNIAFVSSSNNNTSSSNKAVNAAHRVTTAST